MEPRHFLIISCVPYLIALCYVCYAFGAKHYHESKLNLSAMVTGFIFHTAFLFLRGMEIQHCPLTNLFETMAFVSWSIVLNYLIVGPIYRMSLLGAFTAPLVLVLNLFALLVPNIDISRDMPKGGAMLEFHAALSVIAYGTLGLSAIAALMFLIGDHYLKTRALAPIIFRLPALGKLDAVSLRIALFGFGLLSIGIASGFLVPQFLTDYVKVIWSLIVWGLYATVLLSRLASKISPFKFSVFSVLGYAFVLLTFWGVNSLTELHHFGK